MEGLGSRRQRLFPVQDQENDQETKELINYTAAEYPGSRPAAPGGAELETRVPITPSLLRARLFFSGLLFV